jgi:choline dehydrogenase
MLGHRLQSYELPTRLVHGLGAVASLGKEAHSLNMGRPLLVTDSGIAQSHLLDKALEPLRQGGCDPLIYDKVRPNPDIATVDDGARLYQSERCSGLIGFGGGSSLDTAKGIGVVSVEGGSIADYEYGKRPLRTRIPEVIAVPTTAGTGSEVTMWAVITDPARKIKFNVGGASYIAPRVALVDPALTMGLPANITAWTGMDALAHAIECYTMAYHQPFTDAVALHAMEYIGRYLRVAFAQGRTSKLGTT